MLFDLPKLKSTTTHSEPTYFTSLMAKNLYRHKVKDVDLVNVILNPEAEDIADKVHLGLPITPEESQALYLECKENPFFFLRRMVYRNLVKDNTQTKAYGEIEYATYVAFYCLGMGVSVMLSTETRWVRQKVTYVLSMWMKLFAENQTVMLMGIPLDVNSLWEEVINNRYIGNELPIEMEYTQPFSSSEAIDTPHNTRLTSTMTPNSDDSFQSVLMYNKPDLLIWSEFNLRTYMDGISAGLIAYDKMAVDEDIEFQCLLTRDMNRANNSPEKERDAEIMRDCFMTWDCSILDTDLDEAIDDLVYKERMGYYIPIYFA